MAANVTATHDFPPLPSISSTWDIINPADTDLTPTLRSTVLSLDSDSDSDSEAWENLDFEPKPSLYRDVALSGNDYAELERVTEVLTSRTSAASSSSSSSSSSFPSSSFSSPSSSSPSSSSPLSASSLSTPITTATTSATITSSSKGSSTPSTKFVKKGRTGKTRTESSVSTSGANNNITAGEAGIDEYKTYKEARVRTLHNTHHAQIRSAHLKSQLVPATIVSPSSPFSSSSLAQDDDDNDNSSSSIPHSQKPVWERLKDPSKSEKRKQFELGKVYQREMRERKRDGRKGYKEGGSRNEDLMVW